MAVKPEVASELPEMEAVSEVLEVVATAKVPAVGAVASTLKAMAPELA